MSKVVQLLLGAQAAIMAICCLASGLLVWLDQGRLALAVVTVMVAMITVLALIKSTYYGDR